MAARSVECDVNVWTLISGLQSNQKWAFLQRLWLSQSEGQESADRVWCEGFASHCCCGVWQMLKVVKAAIAPAEAPGDGHQANEGVCVRGTQRLEAGAPAAQHAWVLRLLAQTVRSDVRSSLSDVFFRHQRQRVNHEDENESGLSGAPEDRAL